MQHKADEKKAFEDMMAEIDSDDNDSDLDGDYNFRKMTIATPSAGSKSRNEVGSSRYARNGISLASDFKTQDRQSLPSYKMRSKEEEEIENFGLPQYGGVGGGVDGISNNNGAVRNSTSTAVSSRFGSSFAHSSSADGVKLSQDQLDITKRWLLRPCSINDRHSMKCYVERERSSFGMSTTYRCFLDSNQVTGSTDGNSSVTAGEKGKTDGGRFMMSAKKKVANKTSYYLISLDYIPNDDRGSETVLGKVRGNAIGSRYIMTDSGLPPDKTVAPSMLRKELGVIGFEFDSGGPSRIEAWVPHVSSGGVPSIWQPTAEAETMEFHIDHHLHGLPIASITATSSGIVSSGLSPNSKAASKDSGHRDGAQINRLLYLQNKTPKWDEAHGGHVLNFQGRVTESSVKNFQLVCTDSNYYADLADSGVFGGSSSFQRASAGGDFSAFEDVVVLQFGRVGKHKFNMDLRYPLSPLQAFSICVSCLDGKIADRKGYEYIKKLTGTASELSDSGADNYPRESSSAQGGTSLNDGGGAAASNDGANSRQGNMKGNAGLAGIVRESLPSGQYLKDKIKRTFK